MSRRVTLERSRIHQIRYGWSTPTWTSYAKSDFATAMRCVFGSNRPEYPLRFTNELEARQALIRRAEERVAVTKSETGEAAGEAGGIVEEVREEKLIWP